MKLKKIALYILTWPVWLLVSYVPWHLDKWAGILKRKYYHYYSKIHKFPPRRKDETNEDWLRRIDINEAVLFVKMFRPFRINIDYQKAMVEANKIKREKDRNLMTSFYKLIKQVNDQNEENYQMVMKRKAVFQEMGRNRN